MDRLKDHKMPSLRGWYLFLWGIAYMSLGAAFYLVGARILFPFLFFFAGLLSLVSSWFHRLDPIAFAGLVGVTVMRGLWTLFDLTSISTPGILGTIMWVTVGSTHFIIARWPEVYDDDFMDNVKKQQEIYDELSGLDITSELKEEGDEE